MKTKDGYHIEPETTAGHDYQVVYAPGEGGARIGSSPTIRGAKEIVKWHRDIQKSRQEQK